jgi:2-(acetamidomethylene)succinate hydrolase
LDLLDRYFDVGSVILHANLRGSQGPVVILLHGVTANLAVWEPIAISLAEDLIVVALDQRGHGKSSKPGHGYEGEDFSKDLINLVESEFLNTKVYLVGHSLGARNALLAGLARPDLFAGVVAIDFTPYIENEVFDSLAKRVGDGNSNFESIDSIIGYLANRYPLMPRVAVERRAASGYELSNGSYRPLASAEAMFQTVRGLRDSLVPALQGLEIPTLLVRGKISKLVSSSAIEKTKKLRPDIEVIEIEDVDHYVQEEAPDKIVEIVRNFIFSTQLLDSSK